MSGPTPAFHIGGPKEIVHKINLNHVMVYALNYHSNENIYNKPKMKNGLYNKLIWR
jgi:hypothetical protein